MFDGWDPGCVVRYSRVYTYRYTCSVTIYLESLCDRLCESDIWNSDYYQYRCTPTTYCNYMHVTYIQLWYGSPLGPSLRLPVLV